MMRRPHPVSQVGLSIRRAVKENPGIHFRGLARAAHVTSAGQLRHHLDRLQHQGVLVEVEDGRYKRFFTAGDQDPKLRAEMARFSRAVPRRIARLLLTSPMNRTELRRSLGCADSTLGYHLSRMVLLGDLARTRGPISCLYSLTSEETVRKMLLIQGALAEPGLDGPGREPAPGPGPNPIPGPEPRPEPVPGRTPEPTPTPEPEPADDEIPNPLRPEPDPMPDLPYPDWPSLADPAGAPTGDAPLGGATSEDPTF
jgi:DNA-binding HxlR family transcriptional regulator